MWRNHKLGILLALLCAVSMWLYFAEILVPHQKAEAIRQDSPRGNLSDLYPRWLGTRELLLNHRDPYSVEINKAIQAGYYGRVLDPTKPNDPKDQQGFAYPVYVVFLLAPTIHMSFSIVQKGYVVLLWFLTVLSVFFWIRVLRWKKPFAVLTICMILTLGSLPFVQGMKLQQLTLLVAFLLAWCFFAVSRQQFILAGILLAFATIKPQLAWFPVVFLIVWALRDMKTRQRLAWSFLASIAILIISAQIILPCWIGKFIQALQQYQEYTRNVALLGWIFTPLIGDILALILVLVFAKLCWPLLQQGSGSVGFGTVSAVALSLTVVVVPMFAPYNQILLLPAVMLLVRDTQDFKKKRKWMQLLFVITIFLLIFPWIASVGLMGIHFIFPTVAEKMWKLPFMTALIFPLMLFATVMGHIYQFSASQQISKIPTPEPRPVA